MAKKLSRLEEQRVHYRHYGRLLSYLKYHKVRCLMICLVLTGEALLGIFGIILLKPVLDLVFLGELFVVEREEQTTPLEFNHHFFTDQGTFVVRLAGDLDHPDEDEFAKRTLAWLERDDVQRAVVDLRGVTVDSQGWRILSDTSLGAAILAESAPRDHLLYLRDELVPDGPWASAVQGDVVTSASSSELSALVGSVVLPTIEPKETLNWFGEKKAALLALVKGPLEGLQLFAIQSNWNRYLVLVWFASLIVVATFLRCICGFFAGYLSSYTCDAALRRVKDELYTHMLTLEEGFFARTNVGHLMMHVSQDVTVTRPALEAIFLGVLKGPINLIAILTAMIIISPTLTLYMLFLLPMLILPTFWVARVVRKYSAKAQKKRSKLNVVLHETFAGMRIVRISGTEKRESERFSKENWKLFDYKIRSAMANSAAAQATILLSTIGMCAVLLLNGYFILEKQTISGSDFVIFLLLMVNLYRPMKGFTKANNKIIVAMAGAERFFPILDRKTSIVEKPDAVVLAPFRGAIRYENISFRYGELPVLTDVSLEIPAGRVVALVGQSGSGKTTMVNLLPRLWDVQEGSVTVDGHDIRDVTLRSLRDQIAIVTQETILFDDTVRGNIAYGLDKVDDERVIEAAKAANAHEFILALEKGYDTVIGDRGVRLSGGQRQRISIARALIRQAPILILDEATSALDTESEREVQGAIDRLIKGHTALVIAHRLSTIINADEIVVMHEGRIVERGNHAALLAKGGEYAKLHRMQFAETA
jgi:subfamily B ATP-binding cassette protein MsbA